MTNPFESIIAAIGTAFTGILTVFVTLILALLGSGCSSAAKMTPDQQQAVANTFATLTDAAKQAGVQMTAFIEIDRPGFFAEQNFGLSGVKAFIVASANPAAAEQTGPLRLIQTPNGLMAVPEVRLDPVGACCVPKADGSTVCQSLTQAACGSNGGMYRGDGTACGAGSCLPAQ